jgi:hypothetical protein
LTIRKSKQETDKDAIMPLLARSNHDGGKFEDNYWSSNDEEGVKKYFYHVTRSHQMVAAIQEPEW